MSTKKTQSSKGNPRHPNQPRQPPEKKTTTKERILLQFRKWRSAAPNRHRKQVQPPKPDTPRRIARDKLWRLREQYEIDKRDEQLQHMKIDRLVRNIELTYDPAYVESDDEDNDTKDDSGLISSIRTNYVIGPSHQSKLWMFDHVLDLWDLFIEEPLLARNLQTFTFRHCRTGNSRIDMRIIHQFHDELRDNLETIVTTIKNDTHKAIIIENVRNLGVFITNS